MAISSISNANSFSGYRLSEVDAQRIALARTMEKAESRQKKQRLAYLSVPLVAGLATAALAKGNSKFLGAEVSKRAAKLAEGLKATGDWGLMLASIFGVAVGERAVMNKSEKFREFRINHPFLSFVGDAALALGAYMALPIVGSKLCSKLPSGFKSSVSKKVSDFATKLNDLKTPKSLANLGQKISDHTPECIKNFKNTISKNIPEGAKDLGKSLLGLAPHALLFGTFFSTLGTPAMMRLNYEKEYNKLRDI